MLRAVARDLHIAGHGQHLRRALRHDVQLAVVPELPHRAAEADLSVSCGLGSSHAAAEVLPVVRQLDLLAVDDALAEDAQLVADGIARGGDVQRRHGVEIARGQAAEAAVAEAGVRLALKDVGRAGSPGRSSAPVSMSPTPRLKAFFIRLRPIRNSIDR